jgi:hypothetical protein
MAAVPMACFFTDTFGGVDITLVLRPVPDNPTAVPAMLPAGPPSAPATVTTG